VVFQRETVAGVILTAAAAVFEVAAGVCG
jgi:hypothetical protein